MYKCNLRQKDLRGNGCGEIMIRNDNGAIEVDLLDLKDSKCSYPFKAIDDTI